MIRIVLFDYIEIAVIEIDVASPMMPLFSGSPATPLISEKRAQKKAGTAIFLWRNQGGHFILGRIAPIIVASELILIQTVDVSEAVFPNHPVSGSETLPHQVGLLVFYSQLSSQYKTIVHLFSFKCIQTSTKKNLKLL
jgi:hypothetical protein